MSRIPTIERYLARQIYGAVGFVLLGFLGLFAFFDLIAELRDLGNGEYQLRQIFTVVALWVPGHAYELFPIAVLSFFISPWAAYMGEQYRSRIDTRDDISRVEPGAFGESRSGERVFFV